MSVSLGTLSFEKFRRGIEAIENDFHRVLLQTIYLGAFRESEVCAKYERKKILQGLSKPYGNFLNWSIVDFKLDDKRKEKVLLISSAVAKRLKKNKKVLQEAVEDQDPKMIEEALRKFRMFDILAKWKKGELKLTPHFVSQITGKIYFKTIGLPLNPAYEPWSLEIIKYIRRQGILRFDVSDRQVRKIGAKYLKKLFGERFRIHDLRHLRTTHLVSLYQFDPYEVASFTGWSIRTAFGGIGIGVSPMMDIYTHLAWQRYIKKMFVPIHELYH